MESSGYSKNINILSTGPLHYSFAYNYLLLFVCKINIKFYYLWRKRWSIYMMWYYIIPVAETDINELYTTVQLLQSTFIFVDNYVSLLFCSFPVAVSPPLALPAAAASGSGSCPGPDWGELPPLLVAALSGWVEWGSWSWPGAAELGGVELAVGEPAERVSSGGLPWWEAFARERECSRREVQMLSQL